MTPQAALSTTTPVSLLRMLDIVVVHQALYAAAALGVADLLMDQPRTTADLGRQLQVKEEAHYRIYGHWRERAYSGRRRRVRSRTTRFLGFSRPVCPVRYAPF